MNTALSLGPRAPRMLCMSTAPHPDPSQSASLIIKWADVIMPLIGSSMCANSSMLCANNRVKSTVFIRSVASRKHHSYLFQLLIAA